MQGIKRSHGALHMCVDKGDIEGVRQLLQEKCDINRRSMGGLPAVVVAAASNRTHCLTELIEAGADVDQQDLHGKTTALIRAAEKNHKECVKILTEAGADVDIKGQFGATALSAASYSGHLECVAILLQARADVNLADKRGYTPLMEAANNGFVECVKKLVEAGADVNICDEEDEDEGETALVKTLRESDIRFVPNSDQVQCIKEIIKAGPNMNLIGNSRALICAAENGKVQCLDALIQAGIDVNVKDSKGWTAVERASYLANANCVRKLIEAGADVNIADYDGGTPLIRAAGKGYLSCLKQLLAAGADVNAVKNDGDTAVLRATRDWHAECLRRILKAGGPVNYSWVTLRGTDIELNALEAGLQSYYGPSTECSFLLLAAGETMVNINSDFISSLTKAGPRHKEVFERLQSLSAGMDLKNLCRTAIRKHLVNLDRHRNLFLRIPRLALPNSLMSYLLFDVDIGASLMGEDEAEAVGDDEEEYEEYEDESDDDSDEDEKSEEAEDGQNDNGEDRHEKN